MKKSRVVKRERVERARERVLKFARREGHITNRLAAAVGGWDQSWYHLNAMAQAGLLKRDGFNTWRPRK